MSTSERTTPRVLPDGTRVLLRAVPYRDPVAHELVERVQQEYVRRYGGRDGAVVDPAEFEPPLGSFLVAEVDGVPAACGGWRVHDDGGAPGTVEVKRVYVEPAFRRRGLAALVMTAIEEDAAAAGHRAVVLNSGNRQPEALALYAGLGYAPIPGYGVYAGMPGAVFLGKELGGRGGGREEPPWAS
jgi:GNAT superfamily N-acetyltransferase